MKGHNSYVSRVLTAQWRWCREQHQTYHVVCICCRVQLGIYFGCRSQIRAQFNVVFCGVWSNPKSLLEVEALSSFSFRERLLWCILPWIGHVSSGLAFNFFTIPDCQVDHNFRSELGVWQVLHHPQPWVWASTNGNRTSAAMIAKQLFRLLAHQDDEIHSIYRLTMPKLLSVVKLLYRSFEPIWCLPSALPTTWSKITWK